jgi:hypothetical protein
MTLYKPVLGGFIGRKAAVIDGWQASKQSLAVHAWYMASMLRRYDDQ